MKKYILSILILSALGSGPLAKAQELGNPADLLVPQQLNVSLDGTYYVALNGLRVRATPEDAGKTLGLLSLNEKVRILNPTLINGKYVEIQIISTVNKILPSEKYYLVREYLSDKIVDYKEFTGKYFVVINVATETLRVYERQCLDNSCPHKMIMESEVVVGEDVNHPKEDKGKGRSILGSYRLTGWAKFYEDAEGHYPAWYKDGYPETPAPDSPWRDWISNKAMPKNAEGKREGKVRGAFGWYAAFMAPEPYGQWLHGTRGWGVDKEFYIKSVKKTLRNIFSDPRSSGCTRNNNEAIAYLRKLLDIGTPVIKIYAREDILDLSLANYSLAKKKWEYVLTKSKSHMVDRADVLQLLGITNQELALFTPYSKKGDRPVLDPKDPLNSVLEVGTYEIDGYPDIVKFTPGEDVGKFRRKLGRKGNVYGLKSPEMQGIYYIDAGLLNGYAHPTRVLEVSGFMDESTPPWMNFKNVLK